MSESYTPQEMVARCGISLDTLRYYERIGLLDPVQRASNGHRRYGSADVRRVDFLKRLRATGMPISEMQRYVELFRAGDSTITERREMLQAHREIVLEQINALKDTVALLETKIDRYTEQEEAQQSQRSA